MSVKNISPSGNDTTGDGSELTPWRTLKKLVTVGSLLPGDYGIILPGDYTGVYENIDTQAFSAVSGLPGAPITITAKRLGGEYVPANIKGEIEAWSADLNFMSLMGFTFQESVKFGVYIRGDRTGGVFELIDMEITQCAASGVHTDFSNPNGTLRITGGEIHYCGISHGSALLDGVSANDTTNLELDGVEVHHCGDISSRLRGKGVEQSGGVSPSHTGFLRNCYIHDNVETGCDWHGLGGYITGNKFYLNGFLEDEEDGDMGLNLQGGATDVIVARNLILDTGRHGLVIGGNGCQVFNNTVINQTKFTTTEPSVGYARAPLYVPNGSGQSSPNYIKNNLFMNLVTEAWHEENKELVAMICADDQGFDSYVNNEYDNNCYYAPNHSEGDIMFYYGNAPSNKNLVEMKALDALKNQNSIDDDPDLDSIGVDNCNLTLGSPCIDEGVAEIGGGFTIPPEEYQGDFPDIGNSEYYVPPAAPVPAIKISGHQSNGAGRRYFIISDLDKISW